MTDPVPTGRYFFSEAFKKTARRIRNQVKPLPGFLRSPYRGHFAVTRSLVEGLKKAGIPAIYNPRKVADVAEVVVVLSGVDALRQAIGFKRAGLIKTLLAGPNLVSFPSQIRDLLCSPAVDVCITPGPLTCAIYTQDCPELTGRCAPWPAGVDTAYWSPAPPPAERRRILIYDKQIHGPTDAVDAYIALVARKGYHVSTLQYGSYSKDEYRRLLQESQLLIGFSAEESQGIAWAEAWSTDVPTLFWYTDRHVFNDPRSGGRTFTTSPAPQLTDATGRFFRNIDEFTAVFADWEAGRLRCTPRAWVLENMSDEVCARRLCELAGVQVRG
jgi:hypothetical protein